MPYRDRYTDFTYNNVSSRNMKVWVTNAKDLKFEATPKFSDTFVSPVTSQIRYHTATTLSSLDFTLKCIAINVTLLEWRAIQQWLSPLSKGKLQFDFNDKTYYNVKVSQAISGTSFVAGTYNEIEGEVYNIEFSVSFTTTSDWAALGPSITSPTNKRFAENEPLTITIYDAPEVFNINNTQVVLTYTYNDIIQQPDQWDKVDFWKNGISTSGGSTNATILSYLNNNTYSAVMIDVLINAVQNSDIFTLASSINNKFQFPSVYNLTKAVLNTTPGSDKIGGYQRNTTRHYLTQTTVLTNKVIYLDEELYSKLVEEDVNFSLYNYFLLDNTLNKSYTTTKTGYASFEANVVAYIYEKTKLNEDNEQVKVFSLRGYSGANNYFLDDIEINSTGLALYGLTMTFTASGDEAFAHCPFYYEEYEDTLAVFNAGSYPTYPNLFVNLGLSTEMSIYQDDNLKYNYQMAVRNTTLNVDGRTGYVTFNNTLAESAGIVGTAGQTRIVSDSTNNGPIEIPSGNPELVKVRFFGKTTTTLTGTGDGRVTVDTLPVTHLFFQPVGEFKYARNGKFGALIFKSIKKEPTYNGDDYPLVPDLSHRPGYGSQIIDYTFSTDIAIAHLSLSANEKVWVLTIPTSCLVGCGLDELDADFNTGEFTDAPYYYLSLCDYSTISVVTGDNSATSYISVGTRDVW